MRTQRQVVDYALRKRSVLRAFFSGLTSADEVCDASPYLKSAARFHGESSDVRCPICRRENLTNVHYIYGDELRQSAGQARTVAELAELATRFAEFRVFVVEVCRGCGWNHIIQQYLLGSGDQVMDRSGSGSGAGEQARVPGPLVRADGSTRPQWSRTDIDLT